MYGNINPILSRSGATACLEMPLATVGFNSHKTIGADFSFNALISKERSFTSALAISISAYSIAKGFAGLCLRLLKTLMDVSFVASHNNK